MVTPRPTLPAFAVAWAACAVFLLTAGPAAAQAARLADAVTDDVGVLDGAAEDVARELGVIRSRSGVQLLVWYTDTTGGVPVMRFADETAQANNLGGDDALLVVALDDRAYALWVADALTAISQADIDRISVEVVEPRLATGDFAGAPVAAAEALAAAQAGEAVPDRPPVPPRPGGGLGLGGFLILLMFAGLAATAVVDRVRARMGAKRSREERDRRTGALAREANTLLVGTDEAVREAVTELGFAEAELRPDDLGPFVQAIDEARRELHAAFAVRQRLDDHIPESPDEREAMLTEIIDRTKRIDAVLGEAHAKLDAIRDLERRAPEVLAALPERIDQVERRRRAAEPLLAQVEDAAPISAEAVQGNLVEVGKALEGIRALVEEGRAAGEAGDRRRAADAAHDAEAGLAASEGLVEAVERLAAALADAERDFELDLRTATALTDEARTAADRSAAGVSPAVAEAQALLDQARTEQRRDAVLAHQLVRKAHSKASAVLADVREAEERYAREREAAAAAIRVADDAYRRAESYIAGRRRGVGREARTRLQEAERHLEHARELAPSDPTQATEEASRAERLADDAYRRAQADFDDYDRYRGGFGRGPFGGGMGGGRGGVVVIGGFPVPMGGGGFGGGRVGGGRF
ncbi:MAG TPA: TPM domain-containing protein [Egibacteraceae bacterium]|nr:TPM domain-containing protein [Egibacteraceae bacterium]